MGLVFKTKTKDARVQGPLKQMDGIALNRPAFGKGQVILKGLFGVVSPPKKRMEKCVPK